jgi:hypothetical protein
MACIPVQPSPLLSLHSQVSAGWVGSGGFILYCSLSSSTHMLCHPPTSAVPAMHSSSLIPLQPSPLLSLHSQVSAVWVGSGGFILYCSLSSSTHAQCHPPCLPSHIHLRPSTPPFSSLQILTHWGPVTTKSGEGQILNR